MFTTKSGEVLNDSLTKKFTHAHNGGVNYPATRVRPRKGNRNSSMGWVNLAKEFFSSDRVANRITAGLFSVRQFAKAFNSSQVSTNEQPITDRVGRGEPFNNRDRIKL